MADKDPAACASIIRNHDNGFVVAQFVNLGNCSNDAAKLWRAFWGLYFSKNMGIKQVILEIDSSCTFHYISYGVLDTHVYAPLVDTVRKMVANGDWSVEISQVYREVNCCADRLAKYGHGLPTGVAFFDRAPVFVSL